MTEQNPAELAQKAAKSAHRAMVLTMFAVAVAILVLAIDNGIKRAIITEAQKIRGMVGRFEEVAGEFTAAGQDGTSAVPAGGTGGAGGDDLAGDAGTPATADSHAVAGKAAGGGRARGGKPGP